MPDAAALPVFTLPDDFVSAHERAQRCLELGARYGEIRDTVESRRSDTWEADRRRAAAELLEANTALDMAMKLEDFAFRAEAFRLGLLAPPVPNGEVRGPSAAFATVANEVRTPGEQFTEDAGAIELGYRTQGYEVEVRNLLTGTNLGSSGSNLFVPVGSPFLAGARQRRPFLRDLLSVQNTNLASVPYIRELNAGSLEGGASAVEEASAKPEVTMTFESDDAPIRKIAAWIQATEEALSDAPTLRGYIDTRLGYMLMIREEAEVLSGGGTAPHLKGILDFTGVQTQALGGDLFSAVGSAIGKVENVDGDADGVAVNPLTYWSAVVDRHNEFFDGNATNLGGAPFASPAMSVWGLPAVRTRALAEGHAIVGAWALGATLFEREGTTIRTTDSHASLFISNTWVILAEERVGLAVHRPDFFVHIS